MSSEWKNLILGRHTDLKPTERNYQKGVKDVIDVINLCKV